MPENRSELPPIPAEPQQEGARWRFHRPTSEAVAAWFRTVPLDDDMRHEDFVGGVVLIPQSEKVKYQTPRGTLERYEQVHTPYVQIGTRVGYTRRLAEHRGLIYRPRPALVPRSNMPQSPYFNGNMEDGLWWHVVQTESGPVRYLCATWVIELFEPQSYGRMIAGQNAMPVLSASGTKQVSGGADPNGIMKAQTGALGRALGVAGILVVGTGIATAEDMQEFTASPAASPDAAQLPPSEIAPGEAPPPSSDPTELLAQLRAQAMALQVQMQEDAPEVWREFSAWWAERARTEGWKTLENVPVEALRGIVQRMEAMYAEAGNTPVGAAS